MGVIVRCTDQASFRHGWAPAALLSLSMGCSNFVMGLESYIEEESAVGMSVGMTEDGEFVPDEVEEAEEDSAEDTQETESEPVVDEQSCDDAATHLASCGFEFSQPAECDSLAADEASLLLGYDIIPAQC